MSEEPDRKPNEFAAVLLTHANGRAHDEASRLIQEAVEAVVRTGKSASVTVRLGFHLSKNSDDVIRVEDKVSSSIPEAPRASIWFADGEGALHRDDPKQIPMWTDSPNRTHEPAHNRED